MKLLNIILEAQFTEEDLIERYVKSGKVTESDFKWLKDNVVKGLGLNYLDWICKMTSKLGKFVIAHYIVSLPDFLQFYSEKNHKHFFTIRDIGQIKTREDLDQAISEWKITKFKMKDKEVDISKYFIGNVESASRTYEVYRLPKGSTDNKTRAASIKLGRGTKWCTAADDYSSSYFTTYISSEDLIILIDKASVSRKFQVHYNTSNSVFYDNLDNPLSTKSCAEMFRDVYLFLHQKLGKPVPFWLISYTDPKEIFNLNGNLNSSRLGNIENTFTITKDNIYTTIGPLSKKFGLSADTFDEFMQKCLSFVSKRPDPRIVFVSLPAGKVISFTISHGSFSSTGVVVHDKIISLDQAIHNVGTFMEDSDKLQEVLQYVSDTGIQVPYSVLNALKNSSESEVSTVYDFTVRKIDVNKIRDTFQEEIIPRALERLLFYVGREKMVFVISTLDKIVFHFPRGTSSSTDSFVYDRDIESLTTLDTLSTVQLHYILSNVNPLSASFIRDFEARGEKVPGMAKTFTYNTDFSDKKIVKGFWRGCVFVWYERDGSIICNVSEHFKTIGISEASDWMQQRIRNVIGKLGWV